MWLAFLHRLGLALWKTGILKARSGGSTFCEVLLPILLVVIFSFLYQKEPETHQITRSYECDTFATTGPKWDMVYLPRDLQAMGAKLALVGSEESRDAFKAHLREWYPGLDDKVVEKMGCAKVPYALSAPSFDSVIKEFESSNDVDEYVLRDDYDIDPNPLYAAIVFRKGAPNWEYEVRVNLSSIPPVATAVNPYQRGMVLDNIENYFYSSFTPPKGSGGHGIPYAVPGFAALQTAIDRFILNATTLPLVDSVQEPTIEAFKLQWNCSYTNKPHLDDELRSFLRSYNLLPQRVEVAPFPVTAFDENPFYAIAQNVFAIFFVLCFFYPVSRLIRALVDEKETRIREGMRMMGMTQEALATAWILAYFLLFFVVAFGCTFVVSHNMYPLSNGFLVLLFFWLFGAASSAMAYLISVFFSRAKVAAVVGTIAFIGTFFPYYAVQGPTRTNAAKMGASIFAPVAFGLGLDVLTSLESNSVGVEWVSLYNDVDNYSFGDAIVMLFINTILYLTLGWYLDAVVPGEFGVPKHALFFLEGEYWGCARGSGRGKHQGVCSCLRSSTSSGADDGASQTLSSALLKPRGIDSLLDERDDSVDASAYSLDPYGQDYDDLGAPTSSSASSSSASSDPSMPRMPPGSRSHFEAIPQHLRALEERDACIKVRNLRKEFSTPDGVKVAVDLDELDMYEGQIFALLGHNGAGKTTTLSMLTGLLPMTSGKASIYGMDVEEDMSEIRKHMGVCPQHDVLWDDLTVREHLSFFAALKGVPRSDINDEVFAKIREVGLTEKIDARSADLSGGQKRKLSVAIALIGGSKVVFLDEPTSGMDPFSRRSCWATLQNNREGRILILTTHFLDEADLLGDRIGIMAEGGMRCCGSSMFLKQLYGVGYNLTLAKRESGADDDAIENAVADAVPGYRVLSNVGTEFSFQIPLDASEHFPGLFRHFENHADRLGIENYGIGVTTLEEVFLRVAAEGDAEAAHEKEIGKGSGGSGEGGAGVGAGLNHSDISMEDFSAPHHPAVAAAAAAEPSPRPSFSISSPREGGGDDRESSVVSAVDDVEGDEVGLIGNKTKKKRDRGSEWSVFREHFAALFQKRWRFFCRDRKSAVFQMLIPVLALLVGLALLKALAPSEPAAVKMTTNQWNSNIKPPTGEATANVIPYADAELVPLSIVEDFLTSVPPSTAIWTPVNSTKLVQNAKGYVEPKGCSNPTAELSLPVDALVGIDLLYNSSYLRSFSEWLLHTKKSTQWNGASRFGALWLTTAAAARVNNSNYGYASAMLLANTTANHAVPTLLNVLHDALYRNLTTSDNSITVFNFPFPYTKSQAAALSSLGSFAVVLFVIIAFSFIPASFATFVVKEREINAKHLQLISGVSLPAYWLSTYLWDCLTYVVPAVLSVVLIVAFDVKDLIHGESMTATIILIILYGLAVAPFTYVLSYLFRSHSTAQTVILIINMLCMILLLASFIMQQVPALCEANLILRGIFNIMPTYALGTGLLQLSMLDQLVFIDNDCGKLSPEEQFKQTFTAFGPKVAGAPIAYLVVSAVVYFVIALGIDVFLSFPALRASVLRDKDVESPEIIEDRDVEAEKERVLRGDAEDDVVVIERLRKVYGGKKVAVRDLSLGIPRGQVFGYLGVNGAGKTTTLKMLSGDFVPTRGTARLGGYDILTQQVQCRRLLGYTPQFDALLELLTVREHLELFARIKGVPLSELDDVVRAKITQLHLESFENKLAGSLSGGNKRKLSVAIALIGDPELVFLDEPSTGMDPVSRKGMWSVIQDVATRQKSCSIILTTHSMEECSALCQRVGIMVGGRLRCLGSIQHLKHRFGRGYMAEFKLEPPTDRHIDDVLRFARPFLCESRSDAGASGEKVSDDVDVSELREARLPASDLQRVCEHLGDPTRMRMVDKDGSGWALASAFAAAGTCSALTFAEWWAFESNGAKLHQFMTTAFPGAHIVERHGDHFRYQIPETDMPLSDIFGRIEEAKPRLRFSAYSLSQTTLEQIFNIFAAQQEEERGTVRGMVTQGSGDGSDKPGPSDIHRLSSDDLLSRALDDLEAPPATAPTGTIQ